MYVADPSLPLPPDDQSIWRYLDFPKFVAMLDTSELYLARATPSSTRSSWRYPAST